MSELPPLPEPAAFRWAVAKLRGKEWRYTARRTRIDAERLYTEAQVRAAVAAEREACAEACVRRMPQPVANWSDAQVVEALRLARCDILARATMETHAPST